MHFVSDEQEPVGRSRKNQNQQMQTIVLQLRWQHPCLKNVTHVI